MGVAIYLLRVGWRLAALQRGVPPGRGTAHAPVRPSRAAGAAVLPSPAHRRPDGARHQRRRCRGDGGRRGLPRGFRRHADARAGGGDDDARRRLAAGRDRAAAVPADGMGVLAHLAPRARRVEGIARPLLRPERARAGNRGGGAHAARTRTRSACGPRIRRARGTRGRPRLRRAEMGVGIRARRRAHADDGGRADVRRRRLAGVEPGNDDRHADGIHDVPGPAHLADVRGRLGAVADRARQGGMGKARSAAERYRCRSTITARARRRSRARSATRT